MHSNLVLFSQKAVAKAACQNEQLSEQNKRVFHCVIAYDNACLLKREKRKKILCSKMYKPQPKLNHQHILFHPNLHFLNIQTEWCSSLLKAFWNYSQALQVLYFPLLTFICAHTDRKLTVV